MTVRPLATRSSLAWWALGASLIPAVLAAVLRLGARWPVAGGLPDHAAARIAADLFVLETASLVVIAPLAGVAMVQRWRPAPPLANASLAGIARRAWAVAGPLVVAATALSATSSIVELWLQTPGAMSTVMASHATLWAATLTLAALGALCAAKFADPLDASAFALGLALVGGAGLLVAGPALGAVPATVINVALLANPIVATASAAHIDLFRTDALYQASPLAHTQIDYPAASASFAWYAAVAIVLFTGTTLLLDRRARVSSLERTSA